MKKCNICGEVKPISEFYTAPTCSDGHRGECKECGSIKTKIRREEKKRNFNPDMSGFKMCSKCGLVKPVTEFYYKAESSSGFSSHCKSCHDICCRESRKCKNYPRRTDGFKLCRRCGKNKSVDEFPPDRSVPDGLGSWCRRCGLDYRRNKRRTYIPDKLFHMLDTRVRKHKPNIIKCGSPTKDLGCSKEEFMVHIESLFSIHPVTGDVMTWENWGRHKKDAPKTWQLDHIKPLSEFDLTDREQLLEAYHFTNIRPLWGEYNLSNPKNKGNRKVVLCVDHCIATE